MSETTMLFCGMFGSLCEDLIKSVADADPSVDNMDRLNEFMSNFPSGSGYQDLVMFAQNTVNEVMKQFNYGELDNIKRYGSIEPPRVPLENFAIPVAMFQGDSDKLADPTDVEWLAQQV